MPTSLLNEDQEPIHDTSVYKIVGVVNDTSAPLAYLPFADVRGLGVVNYSQIKVVAKDQDSLPSVRKNIA